MWYRVYYNRTKDAPWIWSYDQGTQKTEEQLKDFRCDGCDMKSDYDPKVLSGSPDVPKAWIWVRADRVRVVDGIGYFEMIDPFWKEMAWKW